MDLSRAGYQDRNRKWWARFRPSTVLIAVAVLFVGAVWIRAGILTERPREAPANWFPAAPSPIARVEGPAAVVDGKVYVFGGFTSRTLKATTRVDEYDPKTDTWRRLSDMPVANTHVVPAVDGDTVWFVGGYVGDHPGKAIRDVYKYHVPTDRWSGGPPLPEPRAGGILVRVGRNLHYVSGFSVDRNTTYGDHWVLAIDGEGAWSPLAPLPHPRGHLAGTVLDGKIYAIGGQFNHDDNRHDVSYVHRYDSSSDNWTELAPTPEPLSHTELSTISMNGRIYVFGGRGDYPREFYQRPISRRDLALPDVLAYDPGSNRWLPQPELPVGLLAPVVVRVGDRIFLTNGSTMTTSFPQSSSYFTCFPLSQASSRNLNPSC